MANEVLEMQVNSNIKSVTKDVEDLSNTLSEQRKILIELKQEELKLQRERAKMSDYQRGLTGIDKKIDHIKNSIKDQTLAVKMLNEEQKESVRSQKKLTKELKEQDDAIKGSIGNFQMFGVSINGIKKSVGQIIPLIKLMFKSITAGIMSTGIGALLVAFGSLVTYVQTTKEGMDKLNLVLTQISAGFKVIRDRVSSFGSAIAKAFSGDIKGAINDVKDATKGLGDEMEREIKLARELELSNQKLRDSENEFIIQKALTRKEIEKARLLSEDETKSAAVRLEALQKALNLEKETTKQELELAKEKKRIFEEDMKMSKHKADDEKKLAELTADITNKEITSLRLQKRVMTEVNEMRNKIAAEEKAARKESMVEIEAMPKLHAEVNNEIIQADNSVLDNFLENNRKRKIFAEMHKDQMLSAYSALAGSLSQLAGENKELAAASAIIDTYAGATKAFQQEGTLGFISAAAIVAAGLANVQAIYNTPIPGGGGGGRGSAPNIATAQPAPQMMSGAFELSNTAAPEPMQAYVVSDDITNNQDKLAAIRRRATI